MSTTAPELVVTHDPSTGEPILSHIVNCPDDKETTEAWLMEARIYGLPVEALCGHTWVPSRDPVRHPICQKCVDAANMIVAEVNR